MNNRALIITDGIIVLKLLVEWGICTEEAECNLKGDIVILLLRGDIVIKTICNTHSRDCLAILSTEQRYTHRSLMKTTCTRTEANFFKLMEGITSAHKIAMSSKSPQIYNKQSLYNEIRISVYY